MTNTVSTSSHCEPLAPGPGSVYGWCQEKLLSLSKYSPVTKWIDLIHAAYETTKPRNKMCVVFIIKTAWTEVSNLVFYAQSTNMVISGHYTFCQYASKSNSVNKHCKICNFLFSPIVALVCRVARVLCYTLPTVVLKLWTQQNASTASTAGTHCALFKIISPHSWVKTKTAKSEAQKPNC